MQDSLPKVLPWLWELQKWTSTRAGKPEMVALGSGTSGVVWSGLFLH